MAIDNGDVAGELRIRRNGDVGVGNGWGFGGEDLRRAEDGEVSETEGFVFS